MDRITENESFETACIILIVMVVYLLLMISVFSTAAAFGIFCFSFMSYCVWNAYKSIMYKPKKEEYNHGMKKD